MAERVKQRFEEMKTQLGLSDDQAQKIQAIMEEQRPAMEAIRADQSLSREDRMAKFKELREATQAKIAPLLTPEQLAQYEALRKQRMEEMAQRQNRRPKDGAGGPPPAQ